MHRRFPVGPLLALFGALPAAQAEEPPQAWTPRSEQSRAQLQADPVCVEFEPAELAALIAAGEVRKGMREADVIAALGEPEQRSGAWWRYPHSERDGYVYKRQLVMRKGCLWDPGEPYLHAWPRRP